MGSVRVDPAALLACAARAEAIRAAIEPGSLPVDYAPPGADGASAARASAVGAGAAQVANGLWSSWAMLGRVAETLRANAQGYADRDEGSAAMLSGGSGSGSGPAVGVTPGGAAPIAVASVHPSPPAATPEVLARQLRAGAGAASPEQFAQAWRSHLGRVSAAADDLAGLRSSLSGVWSGSAHDGAQRDMESVYSALSDHEDKMQRVSGRADAHGLDYRHVDDTMPTAEQFEQWHNNLQSAIAADQAYPGVYSGAVVQAQQDLAGGYSTSELAYGQYTVDPATGDLVDVSTGEHFDPVTGEPVDEQGYGDDGEGSGEDMLSSMGPQLLTGLLGGAVGAVGGAMGSVTQGGQQLAQMASQGVSQLAKSVSQAGGAGDWDSSSADDAGLGSGDFGGGGGGSGGGGGDVPAAPMVASAVGPAPSAPAGAAGGGFGPPTRIGPAGSGGLGAFGGAPMMPMGGGGAPPPGASDKAGASGDGKKFTPAQLANTQKVIGQADTERIASKRQARERRLDEVKANALAANEEASKA